MGQRCLLVLAWLDTELALLRLTAEGPPSLLWTRWLLKLRFRLSQQSMAMEEIGFENWILWQTFTLDLLAQEHCLTTGIYWLCVARKCQLRATEGPSRDFKIEPMECFLGSRQGWVYRG